MTDDGRRDVSGAAKDLTTGQMARIAGVAPRTIAKWFDSGAITGYRVPMTLDRRVTRAEFARFLGSHGMEGRLRHIGPEFGGVLYVGFPADRAVVAAGTRNASFVDTAFEAASSMAVGAPVVVVLDPGIGRLDCAQVARAAKAIGAKTVILRGFDHADDALLDRVAPTVADVPAAVWGLLP